VVERARAQHPLRAQRQRVHPVGVALEHAHQLALVCVPRGYAAAVSAYVEVYACFQGVCVCVYVCVCVHARATKGTIMTCAVIRSESTSDPSLH